MDIDIDTKTTFDPLDYFEDATRASMVKNNQLVKHPVGVYFQKIPKDKITGFAAIPYQQAEDIGYFKVDFLHLSLLDYFESKAEIRALVNKEPNWSLLQDQNVVRRLFQVHRHYDMLSTVKPKSVQELADVIALIRPGKKYLLNAYNKDKVAIRQELYRRPDDNQYYFKRSHAVAYALTIVLQLHLIEYGIIE